MTAFLEWKVFRILGGNLFCCCRKPMTAFLEQKVFRILGGIYFAVVVSQVRCHHKITDGTRLQVPDICLAV